MEEDEKEPIEEPRDELPRRIPWNVDLEYVEQAIKDAYELAERLSWNR